MSQTASQLLFSQLSSKNTATAFCLGDQRLTFAQLDDRSSRYARWLLNQGIKPGARIASWLNTSLDLIITLLGHYKAGVITVPINTKYGQLELTHLLEDSSAQAIIVDPNDKQKMDMLNALSMNIEHTIHVNTADFAQKIQNTTPLTEWQIQDEDIALFIYTSGTTGPSKGVQLSFRALACGIGALTQLWQWSSKDKLILTLPLFHVHGLGIGVHGTLIHGCCSILLPTFDVHQIHDAITNQHATIFMGVPTMYTRLLSALDDNPHWGASWKNMRLFTSGSAALSANNFTRFEAHTNHRILERYGMSETLLTISNPYPPNERKPGTIGQPIDGVEIKIFNEDFSATQQGEVGQLAVRGKTLMSGYWQLPHKTQSAFHNGWFLTGDAVYQDNDQRIVHVGRQSVDIIKSGGYKISAREIEEALLSHPDIQEIAIVGLKDQEWGQRICAAIVPTSATQQKTNTQWLESCQTHLAGQLARFKHPRQIILLDAIPRNALGKIQKHHIQPA